MYTYIKDIVTIYVPRNVVYRYLATCSPHSDIALELSQSRLGFLTSKLVLKRRICFYLL